MNELKENRENETHLLYREKQHQDKQIESEKQNKIEEKEFYLIERDQQIQEKELKEKIKKFEEVQIHLQEKERQLQEKIKKFEEKEILETKPNSRKRNSFSRERKAITRE